MTYKVTEEGNISTVFLNGEIDMDVADKAKEVILPLVEAGKEVQGTVIHVLDKGIILQLEHDVEGIVPFGKKSKKIR